GCRGVDGATAARSDRLDESRAATGPGGRAHLSSALPTGQSRTLPRVSLLPPQHALYRDRCRELEPKGQSTLAREAVVLSSRYRDPYASDLRPVVGCPVLPVRLDNKFRVGTGVDRARRSAGRGRRAEVPGLRLVFRRARRGQSCGGPAVFQE